MINEYLNRIESRVNFDRFRIMSGSALKTIALLTMLIDHTASVLFSHLDFGTVPFFTIGSHSITLVYIMRLIGRTAFPIYAYLITEGYRHTTDKRRYGIRLLAFAFISEIPWNLEHSGNFLYSSQNVFFTLFLGYMCIYAYDRFKEQKVHLVAVMSVLFLISLFLKADYGTKGMFFILFLYILKDYKIISAFIGSVFFTPWKVIPAFTLILMYNGERGYIKGKALKYFFYIAYPAHMLLLYFLRREFIGYT